MNSKKHQFAVVTGASSELAMNSPSLCQKNGFDLLISAEDKGIYEACNALRAMNVKVDVCLADLSTYEGAEFLAEKHKKLPAQPRRSLPECWCRRGRRILANDLTRELAMIRLNVDSLVHLTKRIIPQMIAQGSGRILYTSSIAGTMPGPYYAGLCCD